MKKLLTFLTLLTLFFGVGWAETVTDDLTRSTTGITSGSTSYSNWSGKTSTSDAVYAGNSAGGYNSIQLRSSNRNSGIVTTTSGGKVRSIKITWNENTASGRTLDVYVKNSAYSAASDLYGNNAGTKIGSFSFDGTNVSSNTLTISGDYQYIGLRSASSAMYIDRIQITWETGGSTSYTISYGTPTNGSFASGNPISATAGSNVTIETTPDAGYTLNAVTVNPTASVTIDGNNASFTMPASNVTVNASFSALPTYGITVSGGTASPTSAYQGQTVTVTPTIPTGKIVDQITTSPSDLVLTASGEDYTFTMPSQAVTVTFTFADAPSGSVATFVAGVNMGSTTGQEADEVVNYPVTFHSTSAALGRDDEYRLYGGSTNTFSVPSGYTITRIVFTSTNGTQNILSVLNDNGSYNPTTGVWTGEASSVSFKPSAQARFSKIDVYYTAPASTGPEYYLVGEFNSWSQNADYKFFENNGTFTLNNVSLPANAQFKIIKVDNGTTWYGGTGDVVYNIHHRHHTNLPMNGGQNYTVQSAGTTDFSFTVSNNTPSNLNVNRTASLAIKGDFTNNWTEVPMTATEGGWTTTQTVAVNNEFGFVDEFGQYIDILWTVGTEHLGTNIPMTTDGGYTVGNYKMGIAGTYKFTANNDLTSLVITDASQGGDGDVYTLVESAADLVEGGEYIIAGGSANDPYTVLMGAVSNNVGGAVTSGFTYDASAKTMTLNEGCTAQVLTLGGSTDAWTFYTGSAYLSLTSDGNNLYTSASANENNAKWTINNMPLSKNLIANNEYTARYLEYNSGSPRFACYKGTQQAVALFKKVSGSTPSQTATPVITPEGGNVVGFSQGVTITGSGNIYYTYTTDGTDPADPTVDSTPYEGPFYVQVDNLGQQVKIKAVAKDGNKEISSVTPITSYLFVAPATPSFSLNNGTYVAPQSVELTTATEGAVIYYSTTATTPAAIIAEGNIYESAISLPTGTTTLYAVTVYNDTHANKVANSSVRQGTYTIVEPLAITFSPAGGNYLNSQSVTINVSNAEGNVTIYYTTDGSDPSDATNANRIAYTDGDVITVAQAMTINAYASDSRTVQEGKTATATATYNIGVQPVEYSPLPGNYYKGSEDGDITVEMFSITPNAKIYYTMTDDGTEPADPSTSSTLFTGDIPLEVGKTYNFKAIAVAGQQVTPIAPATYTVSELQTGESGWVNINAMNIDDNYSTDEYLLNPVQVVYMSTWRNTDDKPEFCFIRDNSGYGMIYFGGKDVHDYDDWAKFKMGDWLPGNKISGTLNVWSDSFINELGGSNGTLNTWPSANDKLGNSDILPEETTNLAITQGWTYDGAFTPSADDGYEDHIDPAKNLFGHYVHMRKNTIDNVTGAGGGTGKHTGIITDQSGVPLNYYDGLYLFSGYNNTPDYNQKFFDNIQNNGGTFDIYAIVYFYGPNAKKEEYSYAPYEIFPIDFLYIYKPKFNIESGTYMEPQTVELTCETAGAQIWYKTSEMEDYALYTGPITVDATTTIDAYSTIPTKYNDVMESAINSITINIGSIEAPVITEPSVVKTVGESVTTSITCATDGATIYYTTDGSDPKTSETRQVYSSNLTFEETTTVRAIAYKEVEGTGYYSAEAEAMTYTFVKSNGIIYNLVTSNTQLNENSVYVIVNKANNMAVGTTQNENNRAADGVKFVDEATKTQVFGNDELAQFTLKKVGNNWYLQTANSTENGYLYVGNGNTLLTEATADGNAEATINIDGNSDAHISFMYNYETVRYLRYWLGGKAFSTYTSEASNLPVSLYYIQATPLATIEREGVTTEGKNQYTIADQLIAVYADDVKGILWCKDQGNVSIDKTYIHDGQIDFLYNDSQAQNGRDWDQSNWIALQFSDPTATNNIGLLLKNAEGKYIKPATVQGYYIDDVNFTLQMAEDKLELVTQADAGYDEQIYTPNVYCASNFLPDNLNIHGSIENGDGGYTGDPQINTQNYFFMNPKIQEVCEITYAQWDASHECFTVPTASGFDGAFNVGWGYNVLGNLKGSLQDEHVYRFKAVVQRSNKESYGPKNVTESFAHITVYPVDLDTREGGSEIVTAINTVDVNGKAVKSVKYVNVAGQVSDRPFSGVNIVVTEYTDGSRTTTKVLRK